jgi:hypothetical protein
MPVVQFPPTAELTMISRSYGHIDIFGTDVNGLVRNMWLDDGTTGRGVWSLYNVIDPDGGQQAAPGSRVAAVNRDADTVDIFVVGLDSCVWRAGFDVNGGWKTGWLRLGVETNKFDLGTPLTAVSRAASQMDVFGVAGAVYNARFDSDLYESGWPSDDAQIWRNVGVLEFPPGTVVSTVIRLPGDVIDIFAVDANGFIQHTSRKWSGDWEGWSRVLDGVLVSGARVAARSYENSHIEIFGVAGDSKVYTAWWDGNWHGWEPISGPIFSPGAPLSIEEPYGYGIWGMGRDGYPYRSNSGSMGSGFEPFVRVVSKAFDFSAQLSRCYYYHDSNSGEEVVVTIGPDNGVWWATPPNYVFIPMQYKDT